MSEAKVPTLEDRLTALENQSYIMYLQLNAITKLLLEAGIDGFNQETVTAEMDTLNTQIQSLGDEEGTDNPDSPTKEAQPE